MIILGISYLSDASACLLINGKITAAISEERLNRKKNWFGVPHKSIKKVLSISKINIEDVDLIATHGVKNKNKSLKNYNNKKKDIFNSKISDDEKKEQYESLYLRRKKELYAYKRVNKNINEIKSLGKEVLIFGHHESHGASAFFSTNKKDGYILTMDGWGEDGFSMTLSYGSKLKISKISDSSFLDSFGYFYGSVTKSLGFVPHRHEGKVLGLAAYGRKKKIIKKIYNMISYDKKNISFTSKMDKGVYKPLFENKALQQIVNSNLPERVAFTAQKKIEDEVCKLFKSISDKKLNILLSGGVFANVKLNQKIKNLSKTKDIFIFPHMGDGGLCVGAAYLAYVKKKHQRPQQIQSVFWGNSINNNEIIRHLKNYKFEYKHYKNISKKVAQILSKGEIVVRVFGRMEFGPRALGNRSILCNCDNKNINNYLNKKLNRTEFMPFAPITLEENAKDLYIGIKKAEKALRFMTITLNCTKKMKDNYPAAIHVDGTARPQIVYKNENKDLYKLLSYYKKFTGKSTLINTSFNMHEEPIVCSPNDAIRGFLDGRLDYLILKNFLIKRND